MSRLEHSGRGIAVALLAALASLCAASPASSDAARDDARLMRPEDRALVRSVGRVLFAAQAEERRVAGSLDLRSLEGDLGALRDAIDALRASRSPFEDASRRVQRALAALSRRRETLALRSSSARATRQRETANRAIRKIDALVGDTRSILSKPDVGRREGLASLVRRLETQRMGPLNETPRTRRRDSGRAGPRVEPGYGADEVRP